MRRAKKKGVLGGCLMAAGLILGLGGCSAGQLIGDHLPEVAGGLPAGAPGRPANPYQYPAVHDMPPPRETKPLSVDDQIKLEKDLSETRDRQATQTAAEPAADQPATAAKSAAGPRAKQNTNAKTRVNTGAKANP